MCAYISVFIISIITITDLVLYFGSFCEVCGSGVGTPPCEYLFICYNMGALCALWSREEAKSGTLLI